MTTVAGPTNDPDHPDTAIDCESALTPAFQEMIRESVRVGWHEDVATRAMIALARAHLGELSAEEIGVRFDIEALARSTP
jgi:hypothetical protein